MKFDLSRKIVLITGASGGIGRSAAKQFSKSGANVAVHFHRNRKIAEQTLNELSGGPHLLIQADISDPESVEKMVNKVIQDMGGIHVLVNTAGIFEEFPIMDMTYEEWQNRWNRTIGINLIGPANISFCVIKYMLKAGGGKIINVSSRGAFRGEPDAPDYGASKAGLNSLSQSMAKALAPHHIFVYAVAPGFVNTDMVSSLLSGPRADSIRAQSPLGRIAEPEEIAETILFLAAGDTEYLTGSIIDINGASYLRS